MRVKPDEFGLCHRDGCGEEATVECEWVLRNTPLKALTTVKVCDQHKADAEAYVLNDDNRNRFVKLLLDENWIGDFHLAYMCVKLNSMIRFLPLTKEPEDRAA